MQYNKTTNNISSKPITGKEIKENLERAGASKIILTGSMTGKEVDRELLKRVNKFISPEKIVLGSGVSAENITDYKPYARNFIVGTSLKKGRITTNHVDKEKVKSLLNQL